MANTINKAAENKKTVVAEVKRAGEAIMIPENVTIAEAIKVLVEKEKEEEQIVNLVTRFDAFIWEGANAMTQALEKRFGFFKLMKTPGFFGDDPPAMITVNISPDETIQVPWGRFGIPGIPTRDGNLNTGFWKNPSGMACFQLQATLKRKHSKQFEILCDDIKKQLLAESLYKGKAISVRFKDDNGEDINWPEPVFPRINKVKPGDVVFSKHIESQIKANLYTPITKTARCRKEGIPLKRGVALVGPYGCGKTMIATISAGLAQENGWTFMFCKSAAEFPQCVEFARAYQPAVVFCEDIDRVTDGQRDASMDRILNTIDGVVSKGNEVLLVLTSNEVEKIHQGMLRPGRLDAVIAVEPPDAEAVQRLIRFYGKELIGAEENLTTVGVTLAGTTPAVIREVVERAKLTALSLSDDELKLTAEALQIASDTMHTHLGLLNRKPAENPHAMRILGTVIGDHIVSGMDKVLKVTPELRRLSAVTETV